MMACTKECTILSLNVRSFEPLFFADMQPKFSSKHLDWAVIMLIAIISNWPKWQYGSE